MMEELEQLEKRIKAHVDAQDKLLEGRLKLWIMTAIVMQVLPLITIAFFIGGIYNNLTMAIQASQSQQQQIAAQERWMQDRRQWELAVEIWGAQQKPPLRTPGSATRQQPQE